MRGPPRALKLVRLLSSDLDPTTIHAATLCRKRQIRYLYSIETDVCICVCLCCWTRRICGISGRLSLTRLSLAVRRRYGRVLRDVAARKNASRGRHFYFGHVHVQARSSRLLRLGRLGRGTATSKTSIAYSPHGIDACKVAVLR